MGIKTISRDLDVSCLKERRPVSIDLFAGVGGMSLGFEQAGFDVIAAVESDPVHAAVHKYNFPRTNVVCGDVGKIKACDLLLAAKTGFLAHGYDESKWTGTIDCIFGGPPCQGFSTMGRRNVSDDRNQLVYKFADLIGSIRPLYFVMENVPGMAAGAQAKILDGLISRINSYGYDVSVALDAIRKRAILNASDFGVPQDRRRLILLGSLKQQPAPQYPKPTVMSVPKRGSRIETGLPSRFGSLPKGPSVRDAISDLPDLDLFEVLWDNDEVRMSRRQAKSMLEKASGYAKQLHGVLCDPEDLSYPRQWEPDLLTSSLRTEHTKESIRRFKSTKQGHTELISRFYRLDENGLANTLRAGTGRERGAYTSPRPLHPTLHRVISVREAARLHSFPDWFRLHRTKWHGFRSIGNAVPPLLGRAIARSVVTALGRKPDKPTNAILLGDTQLLTLGRLNAARYFCSLTADAKEFNKSQTLKGDREH